VEVIRAGKFVARPEKQTPQKPARSMDLERLGIVLVPDVLERTPAFVEQVRGGSPAARAGVKPDDLILLVGNHLTQSCKALRTELELIDRDDRVRLTMLRGVDLMEVVLEPPDEEKQVSP
jgi:serine protease Do